MTHRITTAFGVILLGCLFSLSGCAVKLRNVATAESTTTSSSTSDSSGSSSSGGSDEGVAEVGICTGAGDNYNASGSGTADDPYLIGSACQVYRISSSSVALSGYFKLTGNVDMDAYYTDAEGDPFMIGSSTAPFTGHFDGGGFKILNFVYEDATKDYVGLIAHAQGAVIKDLTVENAVVTGRDYVGSVVGYATATTLLNVKAAGSTAVSGRTAIGGIAGYLTSGQTYINGGGGIFMSEFSGTVTATGAYSGGIVGTTAAVISQSKSQGTLAGGTSYSGGIAGYVGGTGIKLANSYSTMTVTGASYVGGAVGSVGGFLSGAAIVKNVYSTGSVTATTQYAGGAFGAIYSFQNVSNSFGLGNVQASSNVGPLIGSNSGTLTNAYFYASAICDETGVGSCNATGTSAATLAHFYENANAPLSSWDFTGGSADGTANIWVESATDYPTLWWESEAASPPAALSGTGTEADPLLITSTANFNAIGSNPRYMRYFYKVTANLDFNAVTITPIGTEDSPFLGDFDGNSKTFSNVTINKPAESEVALFKSVAAQGHIHDLNVTSAAITGINNSAILVAVGAPKVVNVSLAGNITSTGIGVGGAGGSLAGAVFDVVSYTGTITSNYATANSSAYVGGLVGHLTHSIVTQSSTAGTIQRGNANTSNHFGGLFGTATLVSANRVFSTANVSAAAYVGGLMGASVDNTITDCYARGNVTGTVSGSLSTAGGLVGFYRGAIINRCYATGNVSATGNDVGGLVGNHSSNYSTPGPSILKNSFATGSSSGNQDVGALAGDDGTEMMENLHFLDTATVTGTSDSYENFTGATLHTAAYLQDKDNNPLNQWNFTDVWEEVVGDYPDLRAFVVGAPLPTEIGGGTVGGGLGSGGSGAAGPAVGSGLASDAACAGAVTDYDDVGAGTAVDPYLICNATQLASIAADTASWTSKYFALGSDIDLAPYYTGGGTQFKIGTTATPFTGSIDGRGYAIMNYSYVDTATDQIGLLAATSGAIVKNLIFEKPTVSGKSLVGALVGDATYGVSLFAVRVINATVTGSGTGNVGGIIGYGSSAFYTGTAIYFSRVSGTVTGSSATGVGGLVGGSQSIGIFYSKSEATVSGSTMVGGLVGAVSNSYYARVWDSISTGSVTSTAGTAGGLVGYLDTESSPPTDLGIKRSMSLSTVSGSTVAGGLVGHLEQGEVLDSFASGSITVTSGSDIGVAIGKVVEHVVLGDVYYDNTAGCNPGTGGSCNKIGLPIATRSTLYSKANPPLSDWDFTGGSGDGTADPWIEGASFPTLWWESSSIYSVPATMAGAGTLSSPAQVATPAQLASIGDNPRYSGLHYVVTTPLDMTAITYVPIDLFHGSFDGGGNTISNLNINRSGAAGLFASTLGGAIVKNITLSGSTITSTGGSAAGLIVSATNTTVSGINVSAMVETTAGTSVSGARAAGIVGTLSSSTLSDSTVSATVISSALSYAGGAVALGSSSTISKVTSQGSVTMSSTSSSGAGGLAGYLSAVTVTRSSSSATAQCNMYCGGFVGWASNSPISNSYATGDATSNATTNSASTFVGGFVGYLHTGSVITNSYARGLATGKAHVGGFVGGNAGAASITNCFSTGNAVGNATGAYIGVFAGYSPSITFTNNRYLSTATPTNGGAGGTQTTGATSQTAANLQDDAQAPLSSWDFTTIWLENAGAYPTLR